MFDRQLGDLDKAFDSIVKRIPARFRGDALRSHEAAAARDAFLARLESQLAAVRERKRACGHSR